MSRPFLKSFKSLAFLRKSESSLGKKQVCRAPANKLELAKWQSDFTAHTQSDIQLPLVFNGVRMPYKLANIRVRHFVNRGLLYLQKKKS